MAAGQAAYSSDEVDFSAGWTWERRKVTPEHGSKLGLLPSAPRMCDFMWYYDALNQ
jgi:hypothetical protein